MNAALRGVVRTALNRGVAVYAIHEGCRGMVDGGDRIRKMSWDEGSGILQRGGTVIGFACDAITCWFDETPQNGAPAPDASSGGVPKQCHGSVTQAGERRACRDLIEGCEDDRPCRLFSR
jgi:hypothetical protein